MSLGPGLAPWLSPQRGLKSGQGMQGARCQVSEPGKATAGTSHAALLPAICSPASPPRMPGPLSWGWLGIFETAFVDKRLLAKKKNQELSFVNVESWAMGQARMVRICYCIRRAVLGGRP